MATKSSTQSATGILEFNVREARRDDMDDVLEMIQVKIYYYRSAGFFPLRLASPKCMVHNSRYSFIWFKQELAIFEKMPDGPKLTVEGE